MKKRAAFILTISCITLLVLSGCATSSPGPQAWIDYPLNDTNMPLASLNIIAHASHADGVAGIEFSVDGVQIAAVSVSGRRLEDAALEWSPPQAGKYTIEVRGVDSSGNSGAYATSVVIVGGEEPTFTTTATSEKILTTTITPTGTIGTPTATYTPTKTQPTITNTPETPQPPSKPNATANINSNCRGGPSTAYQVLTNLLVGQQADIEGRLADNSWLLIVPPGHTSTCWISASVVNVGGNLWLVPIVAAPPLPITDTPTFTPTTPAPDTTPPTIHSANISPDTILKEGPGCPSYSRTSVSTINASDNVGISYVSANWTLRDVTNAVVASGSVNYIQIDEQTFQGTFGPVNYNGTIFINGVVVDSSGNSTPFSQQITVIACIE
ncbi:Ig-like domain-containing protein [Chloroflexota bacterium]